MQPYLTPANVAASLPPQINSGNSGGPVLLGDHVVGIAFQCLTSGENIGYIIPVPVINHFLEDLERNGKYTGERPAATGPLAKHGGLGLWS